MKAKFALKTGKQETLSNYSLGIAGGSIYPNIYKRTTVL